MNALCGKPRVPEPIGAVSGQYASPPTSEAVPGNGAAPGTAAAQADRVLPAILLVIASVALFSVSDVLAKLLRQSLPATEIAWLRYVAFAGLAVVLAGRGRFAGLRPRRPGLQLLRGLFLLGSAVFFITGPAYLPVAEATAIVFVSPPFITALSVIPSFAIRCPRSRKMADFRGWTHQGRHHRAPGHVEAGTSAAVILGGGCAGRLGLSCCRRIA